MFVLEKILGVIAPHCCVGCGVENNQLICEGCAQSLVLVPSRCYRCKAVTQDYEVCKTCASRSALHSVTVHTVYEGTAKKLVHRMKFERAQQGATEVAALLSSVSQDTTPGAVLSYVPTATSRVRARGYDHAALIARSIAKTSGMPLVVVLARLGQTRQVGASRTERLQQLQQAFRPIHTSSIKGQHIILIDDVLTTGATLETAARLLRRAGARRVDAVVFAQA